MFAGEKRQSLVDQLSAEFVDLGWSRRPTLVCVESPPGWGKTRIIREWYARLAGNQEYWPKELSGDRHCVDPGQTETSPDASPAWLWSGLRVVPESAEHVLGAHADQLHAPLELLLLMAARNRAVRRAVGASAGFAAGYRYVDAGNVLSGATMLLTIARAFGAQRDLSLAKGSRLDNQQKWGGAGGERLLARVWDAEREGLAVVLVFDDAHEASESVCAFLEAVFSGPMPVGLMCLCAAQADQLDRCFGQWLSSAADRFPDRVKRVPLARLSDDDLAQVILEHAHGTTTDRIRAFVARADGNPAALEAMLANVRVRRSLRDGAVTLAPDEIAALPSYERSLELAWANTQPEFREVLSIASVQGREFVEELAAHSCVLVDLAEGEERHDAVLRSAIEREQWVVADPDGTVIFREQYGFDLAQCQLGQMLDMRQRERLDVALTEWIAKRKKELDWDTLPDRLKAVLLRLHLRLAERSPAEPAGLVDHDSVVRSGEQLALYELELGEPRAALLNLERTAEHAAMLSLAHPAGLIARGNLAVAKHLFDEQRDAIGLLQDVFREHERVLGDAHPDTLTAAANLGIAFYDAYRFSEAIHTQRWVLHRTEETLGKDHLDSIAARMNLAATLADAGRLSEAIVLQRQVVSEMAGVLGTDDPETWIARGMLARSLRNDGQLTEAITLLEQVLTRWRRSQGGHDPLSLAWRNDLAFAYKVAGDLGGAISLYEQTVADIERVLGPDHPSTLTVRDNLANAYLSAADLDRAIPLYAQTAAGMERVLGRDHPDTLTSRNNRANAYKSAGELDRAIPLLEQLLPDMERVLGPDHPTTLILRNNLAMAYDAAGDLERAISLLKELLADKERLLGPDHPSTQITRSNLATIRPRPNRRGS